MASHPTRSAMVLFALKTWVFRSRRAIADRARRLRSWPPTPASDGTQLAEIAAPLRPFDGERDPGEALLVAGKIENLRIALRRLDGAVVPANRTFSFWKQIGRATRRAGYVEGRELREGCIVPSIGGGLCLLSNALYGAALDAGCEILERHAHSHVVPGSLTERDRDATVFWNYVDLRFRAPFEVTIRARLEADRLVVGFFGAGTAARSNPVATRVIPFAQGAAATSCASCAVEACARHRAPVERRPRRTAYFVDEYWPEHDAFMSDTSCSDDLLCLPLEGRRFRRSRYAWTTGAFGIVRSFPIATLRRSLRSRRLRSQGAARQRALLEESRRLAAAYARRLSPAIEHVVVAQTLLPYLWQGGHLGGRTFDVLITSTPMHDVHRALDEAAKLHPESPTLADFRADAALVRSEREALAHARCAVTAHAYVARAFGERARLVPWSVPAGLPRARTADANAVVFAGSTLGRTGSYEMREAARRMGFRLVLTRLDRLEGEEFWSGIDVEIARDFDIALGRARVVALPAFVEHRPRRLLRAIAAGVPVIASTACGIAPGPGIALVRAGDLDGLCAALEAAFAPLEPRTTPRAAGMPAAVERRNEIR